MQTATEIRLGNWAQLGAAASALRIAVFVAEQGIDPALEIDAQDALCLHAVAYRHGQAVATGRLLPSQSEEAGARRTARIGRMAVAQAQRSHGLGGQILQALISAARTRGDTHICLHAQCSAEGFYQQAGFVPVGARFVEAGIEHLEMQLALPT